MLLKIIAFIAAAIPLFLFVRSVFFRRSTRMNEASLGQTNRMRGRSSFTRPELSTL